MTVGGGMAAARRHHRSSSGHRLAAMVTKRSPDSHSPRHPLRFAAIRISNSSPWPSPPLSAAATELLPPCRLFLFFGWWGFGDQMKGRDMCIWQTYTYLHLHIAHKYALAALGFFGWSLHTRDTLQPHKKTTLLCHHCG